MPLPALSLAGLGAKLGMVPKWLWYVIGAGLIVIAFVFWHRGQVKDHRKQVEAELVEKINKEAAKLIAQANKLKLKAQQLQAVANQNVEARHENEARNIGATADALRLRRPPRCPTTPSSRNMPAVSGSASEPNGAAGTGDDTLAAIPWGRLIDYAEQHDLCRSRLTGWQDWHRQQQKIYDDWLASSGRSSQ